MTEKRCARCWRMLAMDKFYRNRIYPDGRHYVCAECCRAYAKQRWRLMRDKRQHEPTPERHNVLRSKADLARMQITIDRIESEIATIVAAGYSVNDKIEKIKHLFSGD